MRYPDSTKRLATPFLGWLLAMAMLAAGPAGAGEPAANDVPVFEEIASFPATGDSPGILRFARLSPALNSAEIDTVHLNVGDGYLGAISRRDIVDDGTRIWAGTLAGHPLSQFILTQSNGFVFGRIVSGAGEWLVYPHPDGGHAILQLDDNAHVQDWGDDGIRYEADPAFSPVLPLVRAAAIERLDQAFADDTTIDLAIFYSQSMVDLWGPAVGARIRYLVAVLDQALIDSQTTLRARLVHVGFVNANEFASNPNTLQDLQAGAGNGLAGAFGQDFSALRAIRDAKGADIVTLIRQFNQNPHQTCGNAYINGGGPDVISAANAPRGISVASDWINLADTNLANGFNSCADTTYAHEIGHNLGFAHNLELSAAGTGVRPYANGHRVDGVFRTIMSGWSGIAGEQRTAYFSNPDINLCPGNAPCGNANPADPADNARAAREESINVATFRDEVPRIVSSVLPVSRSVTSGTTATAFATIINPAASGSTATGCRIGVEGLSAPDFTYQTTDSANQLTGNANTPVDIAAGGVQSFVFGITLNSAWSDDVRSSVASAFDERELFLHAECDNRRSAEFTSTLNTLTLSVSDSPVPDIVALSATVGNTGRVDVPTTGNRVGFFSVAISNLGIAGDVTVTADTGAAALAVDSIEICQTDPSTGQCLAARAASVQASVGQNAVATFAVFVRGNGGVIPNSPADNRVVVRFTANGVLSGATSVAVRTP